MSKKWHRIYDLLNAGTKLEFLCLSYTNQRKIVLQKKSFERKRGNGQQNKFEKKAF